MTRGPSRGPTGTIPCPACAEEIHAHAGRCVLCSESLSPPALPVDVAVPSRRAVAAAVLGATGLVLFLPLLSIPGLVLGLGELSAIQAGQSPRPGEPWALGAVFLSAVQLAALVLVLGWVVR